jgi:hypothetical protein
MAPTSAKAVATGNRVFISELLRVEVLTAAIATRVPGRQTGAVGLVTAVMVSVLDTALCLSGDPGGFPWRSVGIIVGQRKCPLGIIPMFQPHR